MDRQQKQVDCLLADYRSIKLEIVRRSNAQRVVVAAYATVVAVVFRQFSVDHGNILLVLGVWISSTLGVATYVREHLEIMRLARIIKCRIAPVVGQVISAASASIFPSETNDVATGTEKNRYHCEAYFNWMLFLGLPCVITATYLSDVSWPDEIEKNKMTLAYFVLVVLSLPWVVKLLFLRDRS